MTVNLDTTGKNRQINLKFAFATFRQTKSQYPFGLIWITSGKSLGIRTTTIKEGMMTEIKIRKGMPDILYQTS